jgi:hypothetical protein
MALYLFAYEFKKKNDAYFLTFFLVSCDLS